MNQSQRLMMSQQLRQAITLLQYNTLDLRQLVQQYVESNPMLELDEENESSSNTDETNDDNTQPHAELSESNYSAHYSRRPASFEDESSLENMSVPVTLREHLLAQTLLCQFDPIQQSVAEQIIDAIDEDGYLTMSLDEIQKTLVKSTSYSMDIMLSVLKKIQTFDPIGVGATDIRDCLLIQMNAINDKNRYWQIAYAIIHDHIEMITENNPKKLLKALHISQSEYSEAINIIRSLNPHPGVQFSNEINVSIEPELFVKKMKDQWHVFLSDSILTNVRINKYYQGLMKQYKKHGSYQSLKQELEEARGLLNSLKRRNDTLLLVGSYIIKLQSDFLEHGQSHLKSLNINDVAQALELHESTVSRITTGKYIDTPRGVFELKYFFPSHVQMNTGEMCSDIAVKSFIKEIINQEPEDHAFSDEEITTALKAKGISIARRTVAKYREAMKILPSYRRVKQRDGVIS